EVAPSEDGEGCQLSISGWHSAPLPAADGGEAARRHAGIARHLAELSARLGARQELLSVDSQCAALAPLVERMRAGLGRPWTDFVELEGSAHEQPMHWRLLDGARLRLDGSTRHWKAHLVPLGQPEPGSTGFELHLVADEPPEEEGAGTGHLPAGFGAAIGKEIAPVLRQPIARIIANAETIRTQLAGPLASEYSNYAADI